MNELFHKWIGSFGVSFSINSKGIYLWENWENKPVPTQKEIEAKKNSLDKEWASLSYQRARKAIYPAINDIVVALAEKEEGNDKMWKEITTKRIKVKADNPKP